TETVLVPDPAQNYYSCCGDMALWGNTAAFVARTAAGVQGVHVYVRDTGGWRKQAELRPSIAGADARGLGRIALWGRTLIAVHYDSASSTVVVWERENGAWRE